MSVLGSDFEATQREAEARALGAELFQHASRISPATVDAIAAVLASVHHNSQGRLPAEVAQEFARQMMTEAALRHRQRDLGL
jgi:hypothetical protein